MCVCRIYAEEEVYLEHDRSPAPAARLMSRYMMVSPAFQPTEGTNSSSFLFASFVFLPSRLLPTCFIPIFSHASPIRKRKGKEEYLYSAFFAPRYTKRSGMDHTVLQITPCLPFLRERSPDGPTTTTEAADIQLQLTINPATGSAAKIVGRSTTTVFTYF